LVAALSLPVLALVPLIPASPAEAQEAGTLTLSESVRAALDHHPTAARARAAVAGARAGLDEVASARLPNLFGSGNVVGFQKPMLVAPLHTFNPEDLQADPPRFEDILIQSQWTLEYLLWDGGSRGDRIAGSEASLQAADLSREAVEATVIETVAAQFLSVRAARSLEEAHGLRLRALAAELDRVRQALAEGVAAPVEELRAQAALSEAAADLESARAETLRATRELARSMGVDESVVSAGTLVGVSAPPPFAATSPDTLSNPAVMAAERRVEAARRAAEASGGTWWPQFLASAQLNQYGSSNGYFSTEWNVGLGFRYPIYTGGSRGSAIERARADLRESQEALRETELQTESLADRAETGLDEATARVEALRETVRLMEEVARVEQLSLAEGVGIQRDLLDAESDLLRARAGLIRAEGSAVLARISLARARGTLTMNWIENHVEDLR
jgi:outer membrane protein